MLLAAKGTDRKVHVWDSNNELPACVPFDGYSECFYSVKFLADNIILDYGWV